MSDYQPRFVTETDVPPPFNDCNAAAMAMMIDHWTYGRVRLTHQAIRSATGVPDDRGLNYPQIARAVNALTGLAIRYSDVNNPSTDVRSLAQLKSHLANGGGADVCGMYPSLAGLRSTAGLAVNRWQPTYKGGHSIFYSDLQADGTVFQADPLGYGSYAGERVPVRVLEAFALSSGFGTTAKVTAAFSVVGTRPSPSTLPDTSISEDIPMWVNDLVPITPSRAVIRPGAHGYRSPDVKTPVTVTIGAAGYTATVIAGVGSGWLAYVANAGGPIFVQRADVTKLTALGDVAALQTRIANAKEALG